MKIIFSGYYGQKNTGDDAFVEVAAWGSLRYWGERDIRFLAKSNELPNTLSPTKGYPLTVPRTYQFQTDWLLNKADALISAGGSTIHRELPSSSPKAKAVRIKRKKKRLKIGGIGVSIGPFKTVKDEKAIEEYLKHLDFLSVRDNRSFEYVSSLDLPYQPVNSFDLAALLPYIYNYNSIRLVPDKTKKIIGVSVCPYESIHRSLNIGTEKQRNYKVNEMLKMIDRSEDVHFKFYVINGNSKVGDRELTLKTISEVKPRSYDFIEYSSNTKCIWESLANCDFVISTRLHAAIFACFSHTPFMLNEYHQKCSDFLYNVGYDNSLRLFNLDFNCKDKVDNILAILHNDCLYNEPTRIDEMKKLAEFNFTKVGL